jgi:hypothetical protein
MEKKMSLKVPEAFLPLLEDVRLLKSEGQNPNKMTDKMKALLNVPVRFESLAA